VATVGLFMVLFWIVVGLISFFWTPYPPNASLFAQNLPPNSVNLLVGTQVVLLKTRIPVGDQTVSIPIGVAVWGVLGSLALGTFLGQIAGYRRGWRDQGIMQILDAFVAFPSIVLYLVVIAALGRGDLVVIFAIAITGAPGVARLARSVTMDISTRDYVRAAETRGESNWYIMFREILPNARSPLLVDAMLRVGYAIFAIGTLGFLGLGLPPPDPDWGSMVNEARRFMFSSPWGVIWPSLAISSLVVGLSLLADGLREEITRYQK
jgi:peptide/nickel transport system permease protein